MRANTGLVLVVVIAGLILAGCPSAPKTPEVVEQPKEEPKVVEQPKEEPKVVEQPKEEPKVVEQPAPEKPKPKPVSDQEVAEARAALVKAREWGAEYYEPANYKQARSLFDQALDTRAADPEKARTLLADSKDKAEAAYAGSLEKYAEDMGKRLEAGKTRLVSIQADRYLPQDFADVTAGFDEVQGLFRSGDNIAARAAGYAKLKAMSDLYSRLDARIRSARYARWEAERSLRDSEKAESARWAPEEKKQANRFYREGLRAMAGHDLDTAADRFGKARDAADASLKLASARRAQTNAKLIQQADTIMKDLMKNIESASELTVVTQDGSVVSPEKWSGDDALKEIEEQQPPAPADSQSLAIPADGTVAVLGDITEVSLLSQAQELWRLGVVEKNKGNAEGAIQYFREASRYVEAYKKLAVKNVYTVRLIPERRDSLWRIAEYKTIFANPRLWPILWRRNRALIPKPDLITPGEKFVIPSLSDDARRLRQERAEACYLVGKEYEKVGLTAKSKEYIAAAFVLWPTLKPEDIQEETLPTAEELLSGVSPLYAEPPSEPTDLSESVSSFFLRIGGVLRDRSPEEILAFFDGSVYLTGTGKEIPASAVKDGFAALFTDTRTSAQGASDALLSAMYDLDSMKVSAVKGSTDKSYTLDVDAKADFSSSLAFWEQHQRFYIHRVVDSWRIYAIGRNPPPAGWKPKPAPVVTVADRQFPMDALPEQPVRNAVLAWLTAWIKGDAAAGMKLMTADVQLLRLGETVGGSELQSRMSSYFQGPGITGSAARDLLDMDSAFLETSERFRDKFPGQTYRLSVQTRKDISETVPFWADYQDFYFVQDQGSWKIFAIF